MIFELGLLPGPMSRFMALMLPLPVLISEAPDTTKDREHRAVPSRSQPSPAEALPRGNYTLPR